MTTVGHGTLSADDFTALLLEAGIEEIVDVRSFPGSRRNPQFGREAMAEWLPERGIGYRWMRSLGGRRKGVADSPHTHWRHPSFGAYADYMDTDAFRAGIDELLALGGARAVMCSESVWWRCHRRLIADWLVLIHEIPVDHLMHDGRRAPHTPTEFARLLDERAHPFPGRAGDVGVGPPNAKRIVYDGVGEAT